MARASATRSISATGWWGGQSASGESARSSQVLGFVIVVMRWVFVDPPPELFSAHAQVRRWCDQLLEERTTTLLVILKTGLGRNGFHGRCLLVLGARCVRACLNRKCRPFPFRGSHFRGGAQCLGDLASRFLVAFALRVGLVTLRQTFVHCSQNCMTWSAVTTRGPRPARLGQLGSQWKWRWRAIAPLKLTIPSRGGRGAPCAPPLTRGYFHQGANSKNGVAERFVAADCLEVSHDFSRRLPIYVAEDHPKHAPHGLVALSMLLKHFH